MKTFTDRELRLMGSAAIGGVVIGIIITSVLTVIRGPSYPPVSFLPLEEMEEETATTTRSEDVLTVQDQPAGRAVKVQRAELPALGWVVVHELDENGVMRNALGAILKDTGVHEKVIVELLRGTEPDRTYAVVLYKDDGDKKFNTRRDSKLSNEDGEMLQAQFTAHTPLSPSGR